MKFNMFSKNKESATASDYIANKKNLSIYNNRNTTGGRHQSIVENDMVKKSLNYTERYNMYKGFVHCKKLNPTGNENCFGIYHDDGIENFKRKTLQDYHLTRVDYFDLDNSQDLKQEDFPFEANSYKSTCPTTIPEQHSYFNPNNGKTRIFVKNFKYGHSMSNLE